MLDFDNLRAEFRRPHFFPVMNSPQARRFHLTHTWIYALVAGDQQLVDKLEQQLQKTGGH